MSNVNIWLEEAKKQTQQAIDYKELFEKNKATIVQKMKMEKFGEHLEVNINIWEPSIQHHSGRDELLREEKIILIEAKIAALKLQDLNVNVTFRERIEEIEKLNKNQNLSEENKSDLEYLIEDMEILQEGLQMVLKSNPKQGFMVSQKMKSLSMLLEIAKNKLKGIKEKDKNKFIEIKNYLGEA